MDIYKYKFNNQALEYLGGRIWILWEIDKNNISHRVKSFLAPKDAEFLELLGKISEY